FHVTGVQTCALPILGARAAQIVPADEAGEGAAEIFVAVDPDAAEPPRVPATVFRAVAEHGLPVTTEYPGQAGVTLPDIGEPYARSEERRVGEGRRSR